VLIGIHVSTAGGLDRAVDRGVEREADAIQIFNQSPRAWRPTRYSDDDFAAFRESIEGSRIKAVVIHAIYLINLATTDREMRRKSMQSLTHALRIGADVGAAGVVVHAADRSRGLSASPSSAPCCSRTPPGPRGRWAATSTSSQT
jgi:deoxyribonuclease IV